MFVVFEGVNGSGKTTLIEKVAKLLDAKVLAFPRPSIYCTDVSQAEALTEYSFEVLRMLSEVLDRGKIFILDRFLASEYVYAKFERTPTMFHVAEVLKYDELMRDNYLNIYVKAPLERIKHYVEHTTGALDKLASLYEEFFKLSKCRVLAFWNEGKVEDIAKHIAEEVKIAKGIMNG